MLCAVLANRRGHVQYAEGPVLHVLTILSPFLCLPVAGWLGRRSVHRASLLALLPALLTGYFGYMLRSVALNGPMTVSMPWAPGLGLSLSFHLDGLGLLYAVLVTSVVTLFLLYAASFLDKRPPRFRGV